MKDIERRNYSTEFRAEKRGEQAVIAGHAAVFDQLSQDLGDFREKIAPGAFSRTLSSADVRALFNHDPNYVLGRNKSGTLRLSEDNTGLAIEIDMPDTQFSRDLQISMGRGDISQMSFGFRTVSDKWEKRDGGWIRTLSEVELFDVSPVTYPAYPQTDVAVRSMNKVISQEMKESMYINDLYARKLKLI